MGLKKFGLIVVGIALFMLGFLMGTLDPADVTEADFVATPDWVYETDVAGQGGGYTVGNVGDVNGDGVEDVFVYSPNGASQVYEGILEVFLSSPFGFADTADWSHSETQSYAFYGYSAASAGDVNGDGYNDMLVTSLKWDEGSDSDVGKVELYYGSAFGPSSTASFVFYGENPGDKLGHSTSTAGDVNGDGYDDFLVGAQSYSNGQTQEGIVYGFYGSATGPTTTPDWEFESNQDELLLGTSVSTAGDINNDGYDDIIIGGQGINNSKGRIYVFMGSSSGLGSSYAFTKQGQEFGAKFGWDVSNAGDVNGDGYDDVIVGSFGYNNDDQGRAYIYKGSSSGLDTTAFWIKDGVNGNFGFVVASVGDVNYDGYDDVLISAPKYTGTYNQMGAAYLYTGGSTTMSTSPYWSAEGADAWEQFGFSIGSAGSVLDGTIPRVIVGVPGFTGGQSGEGKANIYYYRCEP